MEDMRSPSPAVVSCEGGGEINEAKRKRREEEINEFFSKYDDDTRPRSFRTKDGVVYRNKAMIRIQKADDEYRDNLKGLSPFDAIPRPPNSLIIGTPHPITITKSLKPILIECSKLALNDFNNKQGTNFVFANLVKSCTRLVCGYIYFITFEAYDAAAADTPNNNATRTFQAEVYVPHHSKNEKPVVKLCRMKPT